MGGHALTKHEVVVRSHWVYHPQEILGIWTTVSEEVDHEETTVTPVPTVLSTPADSGIVLGPICSAWVEHAPRQIDWFAKVPQSPEGIAVPQAWTDLRKPMNLSRSHISSFLISQQLVQHQPISIRSSSQAYPMESPTSMAPLHLRQRPSY